MKDPDTMNPVGHPRLDWAACEGLYRGIHNERIRAHKKHGAKGNSREDATWDNSEWLAILMEEVGEAAHEMTYDTELPLSGIRARLRAELVQVAAMAAAWIAAIDEAQSTDS